MKPIFLEKKNLEKGSKSQMKPTLLIYVTMIDFQCTTSRRGGDPLFER